MPQDDIECLNHTIVYKEIKDVVFQMGTHIALGPDGILPLFYQRFWDMLGPSCTEFIK